MTGQVTPVPPAGREWFWAWRLLAFAAFLAAWHMAVQTGALSPRIFAPPAAVGSWLADWVRTGEAWPHLGATVDAAVRGYLIGLVLGAVTAAIFVRFPLVDDVLNPFMATINGIPKVVVAPLAVMIFGLDRGSKVALAAVLVFFVSFFNIASGLRSVDSAMVDNLRMLGAKPLHMVRNLYLPAIVAWAFSTLRLGIGFALIGVIVGEFVGSIRGVGWTIKIAGEQNLPSQLLGGLATLGLLAWLLDWGLSRVERRFRAWSVF